MKKSGYEPRTYRGKMQASGLKSFAVLVKETDLWVAVDARSFANNHENLVLDLVQNYRRQLENYIQQDPAFQTTLIPYQVPPHSPDIIMIMARAAARAGAGPMAAVAGAFAEAVGKKLLTKGVKEVIVENGGDIFLSTGVPRHIALFAGTSPFSNRVALEIDPSDTPLGICTSSGTVGHALSFGQADAVTILAKCTATADAFATTIANEIQTEKDIDPAIWRIKTRYSTHLLGAVLIKGSKMGICGKVKIKPIFIDK
jgi:ApbE superfamily uncharacterized protein (UPF0280 family)